MTHNRNPAIVAADVLGVAPDPALVAYCEERVSTATAFTTTWYVNMHDKALSGWGGCKGRALFCVRCEDFQQAEAIERAARERTEMIYVAIARSPRRGRPDDEVKIVNFEELGSVWKRYYTEVLVKD